MSDQALIIEKLNLVEAFVPVDLSVAGATGDWVSVARNGRVGLLFVNAPGASGEPATVTVLQASAVAGTGSKALNFTTCWTKSASTNLATVGQWTKVTQASGNTFAFAAGNKDQMFFVEFRASDLDVANGYTCVSMTVADVGATAQLGYGLYLLADARYGPSDPTTLQSAIVD